MCADVAEDDEQKGYRWEVAYAEGLNIHEVLEEDESGSVQKSVAKLILDAKRKRRLIDKPSRVRLGIMRYVYLVIDCSSTMTDKTLLPTRITATLNVLNKFVEKFSEQNPISQIGIIVCRDKRAERLLQLTGNIRLVKNALGTLDQAYCHGEFSLQNSLNLALKSLQNYPAHTSREVIAIISSISTCDPSNIFNSFEILKRNNVRCSVIGLSAEVFVYKKLCHVTNGRYDVILDESHYELILNEHTTPPITKRNLESCVLRMGFPSHQFISKPAFCLCHDRDSRSATGRGFLCVQCGARYCSLPVECKICKLVLISAPQLARSFHHLLPLAAFKEIDSDSSGTCFGCSKMLQAKSFACKRCNTMYCLECDLLLHDSLQLCPACPSVL